jgi:hypothetical protein
LTNEHYFDKDEDFSNKFLKQENAMDPNVPVPPDDSTNLLIMLIAAIIVVIPFWRIFSKAGYSGWLSILMIIPLVNIIMLYFLAFADWPILRGRSNLPTNETVPPRTPPPAAP